MRQLIAHHATVYTAPDLVGATERRQLIAGGTQNTTAGNAPSAVPDERYLGTRLAERLAVDTLAKAGIASAMHSPTADLWHAIGWLSERRLVDPLARPV
jgi:hypothetical protein